MSTADGSGESQPNDDGSGGEISIVLDARSAFYLALANSGAALIRSITITNNGLDPRTVRELTMRIRMDAATPGLFEPAEVSIPTPEIADPFLMRHVDLEPNLGALAMVEEELRGRLIAEVSADGQVIASTIVPVEVMAYDQWLYRSDHFDSLAAFVLPNHPAVVGVLRRASEMLEEKTGDAAIQGYQDGSDRVDEIARAIFDSMQELGIGYINPPAGIAGIGQKIRTPGRVVEERLGTCIDLTMLYASCLAQAGIDPVIVLPKQHAMPAYFRIERPLRGFAVVNDQNFLDQAISSKDLVPVESVCTTSTDESFADAVAIAKVKSSKVDASVLVRDARAIGIRPLPYRQTQEDGTVVVVQASEPATFVAAASVAQSSEGVEDPDADVARLDRTDVPGRVDRWLSSLLDLTYRNPLLNMKVRSAGQRSASGALALGVSSQSLADLEDLLSAGKRLPVRSPTLIPAAIRVRGALDQEMDAYFAQQPAVYWPGPDALDSFARTAAGALGPEVPGAKREMEAANLAAEAVDSLSGSALRNLRSRARVLEQQTGANNLFLTIGTLRWRDPKRPEELRSPLFLWPVRLEGTRHGEFSITLEEEASVTPNYCLIEKLRAVHGLEIPDLEEPPLDESGIDLDAVIRSIRSSLSEAGVPGIAVEETAHLALFNFTSFRLWKDMKDHWPEFLRNPVVDHLVHRPGEDFSIESTDTTQPEILCPIPTDESQRAAVEAAVGGQSFVLEGPPGTGKSQTIANLLASAIAAGKSVLFVAEKQTALTVVRNRMAEIGMDSFCLDLHDRGSTPEQIRLQLQNALDFEATGSVDEWTRLERRQRTRSEQLQTYRDALHVEGPAGLSAWRSWQRSLSLGDGPVLEVARPFLSMGKAEIDRIEELLLELPQVAHAAELRVGHPWSLSDKSSYAAIDRVELVGSVGRLSTAVAALDTDRESAEALSAIRNDIGANLDLVIAMLRHPVLLSTASVRESMAGGWGEQSAQLATAIGAAAATISGLVPRDARPVVDAIEKLAPLADALTAAGFFGKRKARKSFVAALTEAGVATDDPAGLAGSVTAVAVETRQVNAHVSSWNKLSGLRLGDAWVPVTNDEAAIAEQQRRTVLTVADRLRSDQSDIVSPFLEREYPPPTAIVEAWESAALEWSALCDTLGTMAVSEQLWLDGDGFGPRVSAALVAWQLDSTDERFLQLQRWMALLEHVEPLRGVGLLEARSSILEGRIDSYEAADAFLRGVSSGAREERFEVGGLDRFEAQSHDRLLAGFISGESEKRLLMRDYISHRLVGGRPFDPGQRIGRFGRLESDLARKRGRPSVRGLFESYGDIIPVLTPCFMMSPDSVARFLPAGKAHFDLVVFDEASQIEVAWAVGAMGRGDSVVIVGDSQQMPPSRFGGAGLREADDGPTDDDAVEDLESILSECVESRLPRRWLSCHYRSRDESLIAFSNLEFYDRKLTTFPTPTSGGRMGLRWHRVNGVFDRSGKGDSLRTNLVEAEAIVAEITGRLNARESSGSSIAVVTLNIQQMRLVEELLAASPDDAVQAALADDSDDGLIVRNLESVQGDERDVVMLSVAFSANPATGKVPRNFGPLNQKGGERRLNVAITRAREEVLVFCSFEPEDLKLPDSVARGLRCLRDYLVMARDGVQRSGDVLARSVQEMDRHRREIAEALRAEGLVVEEDLGLSDFRVDLALRRPEDEEWRAAVLLDGPKWADRGSPEDRDVLPFVALSDAMKWPVVTRVWLPAWLDERDAVIDRLLAAVEDPTAFVELPEDLPEPVAESTEAGAMRSSLPAPPAMPEGAPVAVAPDAGVMITDFVAGDLAVQGSMDEFDALPSSEQRRVLMELVGSVIAVEGPSRVGRVLRLVVAAYGMTQLRGVREDVLAAMIPDSMVRPFGEESFVWPTVLDPTSWRAIRRTAANSGRTIADVPPEEIANAVGYFAELGMGITEDEAHAHLKDVFGFRRMTENISEIVTMAMNAGVAAGTLEYRDEHFYTGRAW
jgi:hypothetical protein